MNPFIADTEAEKAETNKYGAKRTACQHGHSHASKREAGRCNDLHLLLRAGVIEALVIEPTYELHVNGEPIKMGNGHKAKYRPDFTYSEGGKLIAEDVKGFIVRDFPLRAALFRICYPHIELRVLR
jgi:hypothetical protein